MLCPGQRKLFHPHEQPGSQVSHLTAPLYLLIDLQRSPTRVVDTLFGWLPVVGNVSNPSLEPPPRSPQGAVRLETLGTRLPL